MADISADLLPSIAATGSRLRARHIAAVALGNALEFYDFLVYTFFAVYIGRAFFPSHGAASGLLLSLATFGAGFLTRPVGAMVIGAMGDRLGRRPAMMLSFGLMGVAITGLALTPSYARIGPAAPLLALFFRLLQGFALGGEVGPSTAFMVEAAPAGRRGLYAAMQGASQDLAQLLSGLIGTLLASQLDAQQLQDWGWRLAMLLGAAIVPFGLLIRRNLPETLHAADAADHEPSSISNAPPGEPGRYVGLVALGLMMLASGTVGVYVTAYMTTYALTTLHLSAAVAFGVVIVKGLFAPPVVIASGWLADRFGRKPVMLLPAFGLLASILPAFWIVAHHPTTAVFYAAMLWLIILAAFNLTPVIVTLTESLPRRARAGAVSIIYAVAISIFGGSTQFIVAWLIDVTKNPLAPAWYWTGAVTVGLTAMLLVRESAPGSGSPSASPRSG